MPGVSLAVLPTRNFPLHFLSRSPLDVAITQHYLSSSYFHVLRRLNFRASSGFYLLRQLTIWDPPYSHRYELGDGCCCNYSEWPRSGGGLPNAATCAPCSASAWTSAVSCAQSRQLCPTLCDPADHILPGSSVQGVLQARILKGVAMPFSRGSSQPRDRTPVSYISYIGPFTTSATWEALEYIHFIIDQC